MLSILFSAYTCVILIKISCVAWEVSARDLRLSPRSAVDAGDDEIVRYCISVRRPAGGFASLPGLVLLPVVSTSVSSEATEGYAGEAVSGDSTPATYDDNPTESYYADQDEFDYDSDEIETTRPQENFKELTEPSIQHTAGRQVSSSTSCTSGVVTAQPLPSPATTTTTTTSTTTTPPTPAPPPACFQRGKMPDPTSSLHYYSCIYDSQTRRFVANRVQCPNSLQFCTPRGICTFATSCPSPTGKEAPSRLIRIGSQRT